MWVAVVVLPGTMLMLPLVLLITGRRRASSAPQLAHQTSDPVPAQPELTDIAPASSRAIPLLGA